MITEQQMKRLFVQANPVPHADTVHLDEAAAAAYLTQVTAGDTSITQTEAKPVWGDPNPQPRRAWIAAAAIVAAILGVVTIVLTQTADDPPVATTEDSLFNTTWDYALDKQVDTRGADSDLSGKYERADEIAMRLGFGDSPQVDTERWPKWWLGYLYDGELVVPSRAPGMGPGTFQIRNHLLILREDQGDTAIQTYLWDIEGDRLTLTLVQNPPEFHQNTPGVLAGSGYFGGTYTRSSKTDPGS